MILQEIFTWFDSSTVEQSKLIYASQEFSIMVDLSNTYYTE